MKLRVWRIQLGAALVHLAAFVAFFGTKEAHEEAELHRNKNYTYRWERDSACRGWIFLTLEGDEYINHTFIPDEEIDPLIAFTQKKAKK